MSSKALSAMSMTGSRDGEHGSYSELVDTLTEHGAQAKADAEQLGAITGL